MFHSLEFSANYIKKIKYDRRQSKRSPENFFYGNICEPISSLPSHKYGSANAVHQIGQNASHHDKMQPNINLAAIMEPKRGMTNAAKPWQQPAR